MLENASPEGAEKVVLAESDYYECVKCVAYTYLGICYTSTSKTKELEWFESTLSDS